MRAACGTDRRAADSRRGTGSCLEGRARAGECASCTALGHHAALAHRGRAGATQSQGARSAGRARRTSLQTERLSNWEDRSSSSRSWALPDVMPTPEWLGLGGLGAVLLAIFLSAVGYEAGYCAAHPHSDGYNMRVPGSCIEILATASEFEVVAGHAWAWVLLAGVISLIAAAVLWVRHHIAPMD